MGRSDYKTCKGCGKHADEVGELSHTRLCLTCAFAGFSANLDQLRDRNGPYFEHWARRVLMSAHRALVASRDGEA